eukprot:c9866_g1_i1.p1 GENE.c9866_g1_i1~~c9866_g1_i1.p1  ORF type:complete len:297 (+),score=47.62 c9866_g1_i1:507-1397(+)
MARTSTALTPDEQAFLKENGYVVLRNFLSAEHSKALEERIRQLITDFDPQTSSSVFHAHESDKSYSDNYFITSGDQIRFFWEPDAFNDKGELQYDKQDAINKVGHALHLHDEVFREYLHSYLKDAIYTAGFKKPIPLQSMYICKSARTGGAVNVHQDSTFLYTDPPTCHGFWLSVHTADIENGCLWVVPGSHTLPVYHRFVRTEIEEGSEKRTALSMVSNERPIEEKLPNQNGIPLPTEAGDLVIIHGQLVHWSEANRSSAPRHAFMTHVIDSDGCSYLEDNWLQYADGQSAMPRV